MLRDRYTADLFKLLPQPLWIFPFANSTDLQSNGAGFRVVQQPVRGFTPLESPPDHPTLCLMDQSERDGFRRILRNPVLIQLLRIACRGTHPEKSSLPRLPIQNGFQNCTGLMAMPLKTERSPVAIFGGGHGGQ